MSDCEEAASGMHWEELAEASAEPMQAQAAVAEWVRREQGFRLVALHSATPASVKRLPSLLRSTFREAAAVAVEVGSAY